MDVIPYMIILQKITDVKKIYNKTGLTRKKVFMFVDKIFQIIQFSYK